MKGERSAIGRVGAANGTESEALSDGVSVSIVGIEGQQAYRGLPRASRNENPQTANEKKRDVHDEKKD
jgi:hypothetical protein